MYLNLMTAFFKMCKQSDHRLQLENYYKIGVICPKKLAKVTKLSLRSIYNIIKRIQSGEGIQRRQGSGRLYKFECNDRQRVSLLANKHPRYSCARIGEMAKQRGSPAVHPNTVYNYLRRSGYRKQKPEAIPMLTKRHMENRVKWCLKYRNFDWNNVVFSDESYFQMFRNKVKMWGKKRC
jgi:transposase